MIDVEALPASTPWELAMARLRRSLALVTALVLVWRFHGTIPAQLPAALAAQKLTIYGAAQIAGAEIDEPLKTIHRRIAAYTSDKPPQSIAQLEELCNALGLTITIK